MNTTQLLGVADLVAAEYATAVVDLGALAAAAATTTAEISGVRVHQDPGEAEQALRRTILRLEPLKSHNREFAEVAVRVLAGLNRD